MIKPSRHIRWFSDPSAKDVATVGGKNASLGAMYSRVASAGVRVPNGYAICGKATAACCADAWAARKCAWSTPRRLAATPFATCPPHPQTRSATASPTPTVLALADAALLIEDHDSTAAGCSTPMDIEWAKGGLDGLLYIVQARPETLSVRKPLGLVSEYRLQAGGTPRVSGRSVVSSIATGRVR